MAWVMSRCNSHVSSSALVKGRWLSQNLTAVLDEVLQLYAHASLTKNPVDLKTACE